MSDKKRIFATSRIGEPAENRLREQGYDLEVFQDPQTPPKKLVIEKALERVQNWVSKNL
jgi:hypothetical protein